MRERERVRDSKLLAVGSEEETSNHKRHQGGNSSHKERKKRNLQVEVRRNELIEEEARRNQCLPSL